ncbi:alpha/beta hydrolase [Pediococcus pentosaceus]|uniref:alpha/beta hydrolase n=1 Tax=Pediococcus pentosaceus TaxID=1255 RepID=UPI00223B9620|nr:alpha/beta hydrolase [Pediococcus pentosaceus]MCS8562684.1 alpha/beta hydrolase [Pediococcus pentosaceus]MCS8567294.1 alpha/beta hydrolase [Pediococcus pentosaceus]MCS8580761.1 alpha/beta hydrolase [Pediococcus pentosaceus]
MPRNVKKWSIIFLIASLIGIGILAWPSIQWMHKNVTAISKRHDSNMSPVIFIPGSSATQNRFDGLIDKLNDRRGKRHSLLKVTVHTNDRISYSGSIRPRDNEPFIVVGFENNKDGYSNIKKQAKWFSIAFNALAKKYQFNNFKAIGHSNGGLVYTMYLENYFNRDDISIKKLMTIGSPYNFSETSLSHKTQMPSDFIKQRKKIPKTLSVYSIIGTQNFDNDGIVPARSAEAGKYIYQGQAQHYTEITVTGNDAQHSDLPQNQQIINLIEQYILAKTKPRDDQNQDTH